LLLLLGAEPAVAQQSFYGRTTASPYGQPGLSPYLNLLRGGNPAANYYLGVVPEFERRANTNLFSSELQELDRRLLTSPTGEAREPQPALPGTGHPTSFMNFGPYYNFGNQRRPGSGITSSPVRRRGR
jgi:hypothetical protein